MLTQPRIRTNKCKFTGRRWTASVLSKAQNACV